MKYKSAIAILLAVGVLLIFRLRPGGLFEKSTNSQATKPLAKPESGSLDVSGITTENQQASLDTADVPQSNTTTEVVARQDAADHTLLLIRRDDPYPWVRLEVEIELDPQDQTEQITRHEAFAGDRVRVLVTPESSVNEIMNWAATLGAQAKPTGKLPQEYELVWSDPGVMTLTEAMQKILATPGKFVLAEPVAVRFESHYLDFKKPIQD